MFRTVFPSIIRSSRLYIQQNLVAVCTYTADTAVSVWFLYVHILLIQLYLFGCCMYIYCWYSSICLVVHILLIQQNLVAVCTDTADKAESGCCMYIYCWYSSICLVAVSATFVSLWPHSRKENFGAHVSNFFYFTEKKTLLSLKLRNLKLVKSGSVYSSDLQEACKNT